MNNIENKYNTKLLKNIEDIKLALQWYMAKNAELENELEYYKNAYENRVEEFINRDRWE